MTQGYIPPPPSPTFYTHTILIQLLPCLKCTHTHAHTHTHTHTHTYTHTYKHKPKTYLVEMIVSRTHLLYKLVFYTMLSETNNMAIFLCCRSIHGVLRNGAPMPFVTIILCQATSNLGSIGTAVRSPQGETFVTSVVKARPHTPKVVMSHWCCSVLVRPRLIQHTQDVSCYYCRSTMFNVTFMARPD